MKIVTIVILSILFVACGGTAAPPPPPCSNDSDCGTDQKCIQGTCQDLDCWADSDCPKYNRCIENVCVEKPECATDAECADGLSCVDYKCQSYIVKDSCYNKECTGECSDCGQFTSCYNNICQESCFAAYNMRADTFDKACDGLIDVCHLCNCWHYGRGLPNGSEDCYEYVYDGCTEEQAPITKENIKNTDWDKLTQDTRAGCH